MSSDRVIKMRASRDHCRDAGMWGIEAHGPFRHSLGFRDVRGTPGEFYCDVTLYNQNFELCW